MRGLNVLANSATPSDWGIRVPNTETMARIINSATVSFTELKVAHMMFGRFFV
jgi:hypothetical protein